MFSKTLIFKKVPVNKKYAKKTGVLFAKDYIKINIRKNVNMKIRNSYERIL